MVMEYTSNDLTLKELNSFINLPFNTLPDALKRKFNRPYRDTDKINKTEFKFLIEAFSFDKNFEKRIFSGYARSLSGRASIINDNLTRKCREEFNNYIFSNVIIMDLLKPQLINYKIEKEAVNIQLNISYRGKAGDNDYGYVSFNTKIGDYEFNDVIYDSSAYSRVPSDITNEYKKNEDQYIVEKKEFLLKNIKAYIFIDVRNDFDLIFKNSLNGFFNFDYEKIDIDIENLISKINNDDVIKHNILLLEEELNNTYYEYFAKKILYRTKKV